jgi:ketosteroid isomerase-like protein
MKRYILLIIAALQLNVTVIAHEGPLEEAKAASQQWVKEFNKGNVEYMVKAYTSDSIMITHPIGVFHGSEAVLSFWSELVNGGADDLVYIEPKYELIDNETMHLSARWKMNIGEGYITLEKWVKQADGVWRLAFDDFTIEKQYSQED